MLGIIDQVFINKYGQDLVNIDPFKILFSNFNIENKRDYLEGIISLIMQSKLQNEDVESAIKTSGLKPTFTPCVLLKKGVANHNLIKLINLPETELEKTLVLLMNLFKIGYKRRFIEEKNNPDKWWYWDLSEINTEDKILKNYG
ncbi:Uncharacterised protein [Chryseobacterium nakagawai]|uniref:Uncharacterized protein n=1 Tax=Chryseobacterium nakagawai TaxID=1241982 RepID=A0AAD0YRP7_CHRNA|nr:DUF5958 family protein [Chryseobacterium nakagawai]AZA93478.1 hypothetical protein EG343_24140 [Chryseobacterium nakagawai]VEH20162.1 Uncharacterised protein [Chryseobacterium nakagawai]